MIGTRSRRKEKVNDTGDFLNPDRPVLGDKGVGRLAVMRLGDHLTVATSRTGETHQNVLEIDWERFSHESSDLLEDIDVHPIQGNQKEQKSVQGTTILIRNLRSDWDKIVFQTMIDEQFKRILDPFPSSDMEAGRQDPNELFRLQFNDDQFEIPKIPTWLLEEAHAVVTARYEIHKGASRLQGDIHYRLRNKEQQFELIEHELMSLTDPLQIVRFVSVPSCCMS